SRWGRWRLLSVGWETCPTPLGCRFTQSELAGAAGVKLLVYLTSPISAGARELPDKVAQSRLTVTFHIPMNSGTLFVRRIKWSVPWRCPERPAGTGWHGPGKARSA